MKKALLWAGIAASAAALTAACLLSQANGADGAQKAETWRTIEGESYEPYVSYDFFANADQWYLNPNLEMEAARVIRDYVPEDPEGTWTLCRMHARYDEENCLIASIYARSEEDRELYLLLDESGGSRQYLVMAEVGPDTELLKEYGEEALTILDTELQWTSYRDLEDMYWQPYRILVSEDDIYEYDKYHGDAAVIRAMCSYLASTGTQAQKKTWRLLDRMTYIGADGRLASVCFADGTQRVHLLVDTAEQMYGVVEVYHEQDAVDTVAGDYALAPALAASAGWQETDDTLSDDGFFINAEQVYYDEYAEQDAARAVRTYAKEQGIEEEQWELVYLYSVNRSPRDTKCGILHVFVRSVSSGRKLYLLLRGPAYQKNEWLVIADIQNGAAGAHEMPNGFHHTSAQWYSYDAWWAHERELTYHIRSDQTYNQYDPVYSFQLVCALEAYLTNTEADRTAVWKIDYEKFIGQGSLVDVWYTSADRQVHLVVDIADRMYAEIETYRQFRTKESDLSEAPEEITVDMGNGESYEITKETFVIDHDHFLPEYSAVDYPIIKFSDDITNDRLGEKINRIFYETAMLHYDEELGQEINAEYACNYDIASADDDSISILYCSTQGAGGGVDNQEYAVTVSLADGSIVSLADLGCADDMMRRLENYSGTIYYNDCEPDIWTEQKEKFVTEWQKDDHSLLHGWYLHDGRLGFIFWYPRGSWLNTAFEFELL